MYERSKILIEYLTPESIVISRGPGFLEVVWFGSSPTPFPPSPLSCLSFAVFLCVVSRAYWRGRARSQIIRPRESMALYKSFNTLCLTQSWSYFLSGISGSPPPPTRPEQSKLFPSRGTRKKRKITFSIGHMHENGLLCDIPTPLIRWGPVLDHQGVEETSVCCHSQLDRRGLSSVLGGLVSR